MDVIKQRQKWKEATDRYRATDHGRAKRKAYRQSEAGKTSKQKSFERTYSTEEGKIRVLETGKRYRETTNGRATVLICDARTRARKTQLPFTITKEWVIGRIQSGVCAQTGDTFDYTLLPNVNGRRQTNMFAPSLDQIVPGDGYTPENTQVVCWWWNAFKCNRTDEEAWQHFRVLHERQSSYDHSRLCDF